MANLCCVCGKKIGFMDGYKSIPDTNESVCMQCVGLLSSYTDRIWEADDPTEINLVKAEAYDFLNSKRQELQNPDKLQCYFDANAAERMDYLKKQIEREEVEASFSDQPVKEVQESEPDYEELNSRLILTTANNLEGYRITKQLGIVFGETVFKPSAGQQFTSAVGDMFRSFSLAAKEMSGQVSIIEEARKFAYTKMMRAAVKRGANAIIAIDSDNTIGDSICYLSLYGTAVYVEPAE